MFVMFAFALATALVPAVPAAPPIQEVKVVGITASSTMPKWKDYTFDAANLIDGRVDTSWQPAKKDTIGVGEWVELDLGAPYEIDHIDIAQGLQKVDPKLGDLFCRNNRLSTAYLLLDDGSHAPCWIDARDLVGRIERFYRGVPLHGDPSQPRQVRVVTRFIRLVVTTVLDPVDWKDLAIAEIRVFGRPADAPTVDPVAIAWDQPGSYPLKAAFTEFCALDLAGRRHHECGYLTATVASGWTIHNGYEKLPPVPVAERDKGKVTLRFAYDEVRVEVDFIRDANQKWSVERLSRVDASGRPAPPASADSVEKDLGAVNQCWEKLGKTRPLYSLDDYYP